MNNDLSSSVKALNDNINRLFDLFSVASKDVKVDKTASLNAKLDTIIEQHHEIAEEISKLREIVEGKIRTPIKPMKVPQVNELPTPMRANPMPQKLGMPPPPLNPLGK